MKNASELPLRDRLAAIAAFLSELERPDQEFGAWNSSQQAVSGAYAMPWVDYSVIVKRFIRTAYDLGWVRPEVNWPEWAQTPEAIRLRDEPDAIKQATEDQLARLLTVVVRADRFAEGELLAAFESGLIEKIVRRASALLDALNEGELPEK
jgi:hypothetical protein